MCKQWAGFLRNAVLHFLGSELNVRLPSEPKCIWCFSYCGNKILGTSSLGRGRFPLAHSFKLQSIAVAGTGGGWLHGI